MDKSKKSPATPKVGRMPTLKLRRLTFTKTKAIGLPQDPAVNKHPTNTNYYNALSDDSEEENMTIASPRKRKTPKAPTKDSTKAPVTKPSPNEPNKTKRAPKPPPVVITTDVFSFSQEAFKSNNITQYHCKKMSIGTKVFLENFNDHSTLTKHLQHVGIDFYTHQSHEQKILKVVLAGLPKISVDTVKSELATLNVKPTQLFEMTTKNPSQQKALFLLHLSGNDVTLADLKKIRYFYHHTVSWDIYKPKQKGPTQCRNCSMYGHGTQNCFRKSVCLLCASRDHGVSNCPLKQTPAESKSSPTVFKCFYCSGKNLPANHRASDLTCPGRKLYVDIRHNIMQKKRAGLESAKREQINNQTRHNFKAAPKPPPLSQTYRDAMLPQQNQAVPNGNVTTAVNDNYPPEVNNTSNDLLTTAELFRIFNSTLADFRKCKTKDQQIEVLAKLLSHVV